MNYQKQKIDEQKQIKWLTPHNKTVYAKHTHLRELSILLTEMGEHDIELGGSTAYGVRSKGKQRSFDKTCQLTLVEEATLFALTPFL